MNQLVSIRTNISYRKELENEEVTYLRQQELVLLVDEPKYTYSNEGAIIRERGLKELRFTVSEQGMENLIELLEQLKEVEPDNLT